MGRRTEVVGSHPVQMHTEGAGVAGIRHVPRGGGSRAGVPCVSFKYVCTVLPAT